jgi:hypothetical protein
MFGPIWKNSGGRAESVDIDFTPVKEAILRPIPLRHRKLVSMEIIAVHFVTEYAHERWRRNGDRPDS